MRRVWLVLVVLVALVGCGGTAPTVIPSPTPPPTLTAEDFLRAVEQSGLVMTRKPSQNLYACARQTGLMQYHEFVQREEIFYPRHAVASYDTPANAENARAACSQASPFRTAGWRRGTVVLVWSPSDNVAADSWHPYFAVLQALR